MYSLPPGFRCYAFRYRTSSPHYAYWYVASRPFLASRLTRAVYTYVIVYFGDVTQLENLVWYVSFSTSSYAHASQPLIIGVSL